MALDPNRRAELDEARARALVAGVADVDGLAARRLPEVIAFRAPGPVAHAVLLEAGERAFGTALLWARRAEATELTLVIDPAADPGGHARRAAAFAPRVEVLVADGIKTSPAAAESLPVAPAVPAAAVEIVERIGSLGLDLLVDHGELIVEYLGLEVGRVATSEGVAALEVGVGAIDREANRVLRGRDPAFVVLDDVVARVAEHRRAGGAQHPLRGLARERWLDRSLRAVPAEFGATEAVGIMPTAPRRGMRDRGSAASRHEGGGVVTLVVSTVGADVGLLGAVPDLIAREEPDRVVVAVPNGDFLEILHGLTARLRVPTTVKEVRPPWLSDDVTQRDQ